MATEDPLPKCYCLCGIGIPLRYFSLCALTVQTTAAVILTRYSKLFIAADDVAYASTSLVVTTEVLKFIISVSLIYVFDAPAAILSAKMAASKEAEEGSAPSNGVSVSPTPPTSASGLPMVKPNDTPLQAFRTLLYAQNLAVPTETMKLAVPALLYTLQNNMIYVALANLEATTFQVGYQSKVITTAVLSVMMLNRSLSWTKWSALMLLTFGIICTQIKLDTNTQEKSDEHVNRTVGVAAVLFSAFCSAFAGVYFEKILKGTNPSVWMRNAQLAFFSTIIGVLTYKLSEPDEVRFFQGYNGMVATLILTQAAGGLIIAVVVKYADNILKGFATALSIVLCGGLSAFFMGFVPTFLFVLGSLMAIAATMLYSV